MSHLVFNSFPRSGQVFLSNLAQYAFSTQMSTAHLPEIFGVSELQHVSIFREPSEAIASLVNKTREHSGIQTASGALDIEKIDEIVSRAIKTYESYLENVENNLDSVHVVLFSNLIADYDQVINSIAKRFSLQIKQDYDFEISFDPSSPIWSDKYDGHMPRDKDDTRLEIESAVRSINAVKELSNKYRRFLDNA
jgi:hypothetical protein